MRKLSRCLLAYCGLGEIRTSGIVTVIKTKGHPFDVAIIYKFIHTSTSTDDEIDMKNWTEPEVSVNPKKL